MHQNHSDNTFILERWIVMNYFLIKLISFACFMELEWEITLSCIFVLNKYFYIFYKRNCHLRQFQIKSQISIYQITLCSRWKFLNFLPSYSYLSYMSLYKICEIIIGIFLFLILFIPSPMVPTGTDCLTWLESRRRPWYRGTSGYPSKY